jgi:hypothetical protein
MLLYNNDICPFNPIKIRLRPIPYAGPDFRPPETSSISLGDSTFFDCADQIELFKIRKLVLNWEVDMGKLWKDKRNKIMAELFGIAKKNKKNCFASQRPDNEVKAHKLDTHKNRYNCAMAGLVAPINPFRVKADSWFPDQKPQDWTLIDKLFKSITLDTCTSSFLWRSTHGLLYFNLKKAEWGLVDKPLCHLCDAGVKQTDEHVWLDCWRVSQLFERFRLHYKVKEFNPVERWLGIDTNEFASPEELKMADTLKRDKLIDRKSVV